MFVGFSLLGLEMVGVRSMDYKVENCAVCTSPNLGTAKFL